MKYNFTFQKELNYLEIMKDKNVKTNYLFILKLTENVDNILIKKGEINIDLALLLLEKGISVCTYFEIKNLEKLNEKIKLKF